MYLCLLKVLFYYTRKIQILLFILQINFTRFINFDSLANDFQCPACLLTAGKCRELTQIGHADNSNYIFKLVNLRYHDFAMKVLIVENKTVECADRQYQKKDYFRQNVIDYNQFRAV